MDVRDGTHDSPKYTPSGYPLVTSKNLVNGQIDFSTCSFISKEDFDTIEKRSAVDDGDILYAMIGTIGNPVIVQKQSEFAIKNVALFKFNNQNISNRYVYHFLNSELAVKQFNSNSRGGTQKFVSLTNIRDLKIPLPPLAEQQKIAAILDAADNLRQKDHQLVERYTALSQSLFLEMFGDPVTNPMGWPKPKFGLLVKIERGGSPRPISEYLGGSYPWIKIGDATKGNEIYLEKTKEHIIERGLSKTRLLPAGSIIFANCGVSLGFARIITFSGCIHDGWLSFSEINEERLNKIFILKTLNSITNYFRNSAPEGTQPNLNTSIMKNFEFILPPIELQNQFAERIQLIEAQKQQAQRSLEKSEALFNSLLQRAFTGELTAKMAA